MFIREDLLNEIKGIFGIKEFHYTRAMKTIYGETLLLFKAEGRTIAIEFEKENIYFIYEVEEEFSCRFIVGLMVRLSITKEETCLKLDDTIIKLSGKAFDFTEALVLLALEDN